MPPNFHTCVWKFAYLKERLKFKYVLIFHIPLWPWNIHIQTYGIQGRRSLGGWGDSSLLLANAITTVNQIPCIQYLSD